MADQETMDELYGADCILVDVMSVIPIPGSSLWIGVGLDEDGREVRWGGDQRAMFDIAQALERDGDPKAVVPSWAIISREEPEAEPTSLNEATGYAGW